MKLTELMTENLVDPALKGAGKDEVIDLLIEKLDAEGVLKSKRKFKKAIEKREKEGSTGIGFKVAIPHGKSKAVNKPAVAFGLSSDGVDWNSVDGDKAQLIFMIAVPEESAGNEHLKILQMLSIKLMDEAFRNELLQASTQEEAWQLLEQIG
ncbi:PTS transporter subunit IIA-like nitrogen-regulatory protein PtsN [Fictibacillus macauensis ZFHKF-1]|uniref:PTS transporter subunit IIA-like nitrogen-regulatory protein PtsN n=1 Tax=Fictibacillus macauensis ZFHKF-1 TaxID=1196324 RepID=I8AH34_9BACL|nr:PTS transporter subunit IIA-like nitrogen-regulatory protein PtsN [Fictibacillus macauensis ZFHKF-1]